MSFCMMSRTSPGLGTLRGRFSFSALQPCGPPSARNSCIGGYVAHSNIGVRTSDAAHLHQYVTATEAGAKAVLPAPGCRVRVQFDTDLSFGRPCDCG